MSFATYYFLQGSNEVISGNFCATGIRYLFGNTKTIVDC